MGIKVAFGSVPKESGTFTFYRNQRLALKELDVEMYCVSLGKQQALLWDDEFVDENCVLLARDSYSIKKQSKAFVDWCVKMSIDIVIGVNSVAILSSYPHLPTNIKVMARCANAFDHGYKITMIGGERLLHIVALTPRLEKDLIEGYAADPNKISLIPNGIDPRKFEASAMQKRGTKKLLEIAFVGRLEHEQKGVLHIPHIVKELNALNIPFRLRIAGKGKHEAELKAALEEEITNQQVQLVGALNSQEVIQFLGESDIYLFTSHFEGCPNALLEAMMAACVPVSWIIDGITDFIIEDKVDGRLIPTGAYTEMAESIAELNEDRSMLHQWSQNAAQTARKRFTNSQTAAKYKRVFEYVLSLEQPNVEVKSWSKFKMNSEFAPKRFAFLPTTIRERLKNLLR